MGSVRETSTVRAVVLLAISFFSALFAWLAFAYFVQCDFLQYGSHGKSSWSVASGYTVKQFLAFCAYLVLWPIAVASMLIFLATVYKQRLFPRTVRLALFTFLCLAFVGTAVGGSIVADDTLSCGIIGCVSSDISSSTYVAGGGIQQWGGYLILALSLFFALVNLNLLVNTILMADEPAQDHNNGQVVERESLLDEADSASAPLAPAEKENNDRWLIMSALVLVYVIILPILFFASGLLPNTFEYWYSSGIKSFASTTVARTQAECLTARENGMICPEFDTAYFTTFTIEVSSGVYAKVFPDVLIFYIFIYAVSIWGIISNHVGRTMLHKQRKIVSNFTVSFSQIVVTGMFALTVILFFTYWFHDHNWHSEWPSVTLSNNQKLARASGLVAALILGCMFIPVSRNSIFSRVMGMSWESVLWVHIWLGYLLFVFILVHMFSWWRVWYLMDDGIFPHDILAVPTYYPINGKTAAMLAALGPTSDNWTIPLGMMAFMGAIVCNFIPSYSVVRRQYFEVFYYLHHFFIVFWSIGLVHGTSSWPFIVPGLSLWVVDRGFRYFWGTRFVAVRGLRSRTNGEVTELAVEVEQSMSWRIKGPIQAQAGQYVLLNIPAISPFEWHPFTISSAPADPISTFHIRNMGEGTWTGQLHGLAVANTAGEASNLVVNYDGPYGAPPKYSDYDVVFLAAGGIGITPLHSTFRDLYGRALGSDDFANVRLVWVARQASLFNIFESTLRTVKGNDLRGKFSVGLYADDTKPGDDEDSKSAGYEHGRPNWPQEFEALQKDVEDPASLRVLVYACGPMPFVEDCARFSHQFGYTFHTEAFQL